LRSRIERLGLESFVKSTGGKGLHVVVPVEAEREWAAVKDFAHHIVMDMEREQPDLYVTKMTKAVRKNHIYLDYLRNDREATSVAPYSPRAKSGVPVAMPLRWDELDSAEAPSFHVTDFERWRSRLRNDPWAGLAVVRQHLTDTALHTVGADAQTHSR
jgi:bifunctional non-homologous end joining protein LigD